MNVRKLIGILVAGILIALFMNLNIFQKKSKTSKVLKSWIANPNQYKIEEQFKLGENAELNNQEDVKVYLKALEKIEELFEKREFSNLDRNLYELIVILQNCNKKKVFLELNDKAIPVLTKVYGMYLNNFDDIEKGQFSTTDLMILKIFAIYPSQKSHTLLVNSILDNYRSSEYLWSVIFDVLSKKEMDFEKFIGSLNGTIPKDFLGISYLDFCNSLLLEKKISRHPFNSLQGKTKLSELVKLNDENYSYAISATTSAPFLDNDIATELLDEGSKNKNVEVQLESAWAGAKMNIQTSREKLVSFSKDYRYALRAIQYLEELGLQNLIAEESKTEHFLALAEMSNWLSHPSEFGTYPDKAEVFDNRILYWPPTKDKRSMYIVRYTYNNYNDDGSDEIGIGLVGSITFSLFGTEGILEKTPLEIYALHCNWELEDDNYENIPKGIKLLKARNSFD